MLEKLPEKFIEPMIDALPIEITFVDAEDIGRYYSKNGKRIFARTPKVIGSKVQDCHPEKSREKVEKVLQGLRNGTLKSFQQKLENRQGRKILNSYFPVKDKEGNYLGCIEVTQDVTEIQKLKGQTPKRA